MFETFTILFQEAARVVHRRAESLALRLLTRTPKVLARAFALGGGAAQRLHLAEVVETVVHVEQTAELAVENAVEDVAAAGPLIVRASARALALRRRAVPIALALGAAGFAVLAARRAARGRRAA